MATNSTNSQGYSRRSFLQDSAQCGLASALIASLAAAQETSKPSSTKAKSVFRAAEFNHIALDTPNRDQAIGFYESNFGMTNISHGRAVRDTFLHFEKGFINLGDAEKAGLNHFCLGIQDFEPEVVFRTLSMLDLKPFKVGENNLHILDPDGLNVQIQEIGHGYQRVDSAQLTQAKKGLLQTISIHHLSVMVTDLARSRDFYTEMFGLNIIKDDESKRCVLAVGRGFMELRKGTKAAMNHFCLACKKFNATELAAKLVEAGIDKVVGKESLVSLHDSSGLVIQVIAAN